MSKITRLLGLNMCFCNSVLIVLLMGCFALISPHLLPPHGCPDEEDIKPCICIFDVSFRSSVECHGANQTSSRIKVIFLQSSGRTFAEVKVENVSLDSLPAEIFESTQVTSLLVDTSNLRQLFDRAPQVEYKVHIMTLSSLVIENGVEFKYLGGIKRLTMLSIEDTILPVIGQEFQDFVSSEVKFVSFERTETISISQGAFSKLTNLKSLTIAETKISDISRDILSYPSHVENIFLNYNRLRSLPEDFFSGMPHLKMLSLVGNDFKSLEQATMAPIWNILEYVGVDANPIRCDCGLRWLLLNARKKDILRGTCYTPNHWQNKDFRNFEDEDFQYCDEIA